VIEHKPWVGPRYADEGICGQRIAIIGYSAWVEPDDADYVITSIENVVSGAWKGVRFYDDIASYFGMQVADFYERVIQFEFIPCSIGGPNDRYKTAPPELVEVGHKRALRIARDHDVDKLLFFSRKAWLSMPPTIEHSQGFKRPLGDTGFEMGHFDLGSRMVLGVGLRHTQYAKRDLMVRAVQLAMAEPVHQALLPRDGQAQ
jgi:hypothetical protein